VDYVTRILRVIFTFQIISLAPYRDKLLDFTMAEIDPKITFEPTPTRTNDEDMYNTVRKHSSVGSNFIAVERLDSSKEGGRLRASLLVFRDRASYW
jgi:hypothetical protein